MLLHWGGLYQSALRLDDHVLPALRRVAQETGEGASYFIRRNDMRVCLFRVDSPKMLRDHIHVGDLLPLDRGAAGRVLIDFDPDLTSFADRPQSPVIATAGEREPDISALAAPVFGPQQTLKGAIAISGPTNRFLPNIVPQMTAALIRAAIEITERLGGNPGILTRPLTDQDMRLTAAENP